MLAPPGPKPLSVMEICNCRDVARRRKALGPFVARRRQVIFRVELVSRAVSVNGRNQFGVELAKLILIKRARISVFAPDAVIVFDRRFRSLAILIALRSNIRGRNSTFEAMRINGSIGKALSQNTERDLNALIGR